MMSTMKKFIGACVAMSLAAAVGVTAELTVPQSAFLERHCFDCHADTAKEGGLDLGGLSRDLADAETLRRWVRVFDRVEAGEMPPKDVKRPDSGAKKAFLASLGETLVAADRAQRDVVHRRLNRVEYENTVRDL